MASQISTVNCKNKSALKHFSWPIYMQCALSNINKVVIALNVYMVEKNWNNTVFQTFWPSHFKDIFDLCSTTFVFHLYQRASCNQAKWYSLASFLTANTKTQQCDHSITYRYLKFSDTLADHDFSVFAVCYFLAQK